MRRNRVDKEVLTLTAAYLVLLFIRENVIYKPDKL